MTQPLSDLERRIRANDRRAATRRGIQGILLVAAIVMFYLGIPGVE